MTIIFDGTQGITTPTETANNSVTTPVVKSSANLVFQTNGTTEAMRIDTSQNVGIGTASPSSYGKFAVSGQSSLGVDQTDYVNVLGGGGTARVEAVGGNSNINLALSTKGTGAFYIWRGGYGGTNTFLIDGSGRITMPAQPYIIAARTGSSFTTDGTTPIQFNTILNQVGITASNSNSRFTVPVAGTYLICFHWFLTNPSNLDNAMTVLVNGTEIYRFGANNNGLSGTPSNSGDGAAQMWYFNANDYVDFRGSGAKTVLGANPYHTVVSIGKIY